MPTTQFTPARQTHEDRDDGAIHKAFIGYREETTRAQLPGGGVMRFAAKVQDTVNGVVTILELLENDDIANEFNDRKILNDNDRGRLMRLAIASLTSIGGDADGLMSWAYNHHTPEGQAEKATVPA